MNITKTELPGIRSQMKYSEEIRQANLVIGLYQDNAIRILKNRFVDQTGYVSRDEAINTMARILSKNIFGNNDLRMFQLGLEQEIIKSIKETIDKFHTKGGE
jgi:hypothetical protein